MNFSEGICECTPFRQSHIPCLHMFAVIRRGHREFLDLPESLLSAYHLNLHDARARPITRSSQASTSTSCIESSESVSHSDSLPGSPAERDESVSMPRAASVPVPVP